MRKVLILLLFASVAAFLAMTLLAGPEPFNPETTDNPSVQDDTGEINFSRTSVYLSPHWKEDVTLSQEEVRSISVKIDKIRLYRPSGPVEFSVNRNVDIENTAGEERHGFAEINISHGRYNRSELLLTRITVRTDSDSYTVNDTSFTDSRPFSLRKEQNRFLFEFGLVKEENLQVVNFPATGPIEEGE